MTKKSFFLLKVFLICLASTNISLADIQKDLINKLTATKTLSFDFKQQISDEEEIGNCFIKYPLLMKCNYEDVKKKSIISNGETVAIIKRKYKKIYYYPIEKTLLLVILEKNKIINLIKNNKPVKVDDSIIKYEFFGKKSNKLKLFFDKNSLDLKGWETIDAYSNRVKFSIINLETNVTISDDFFKIPREKDL